MTWGFIWMAVVLKIPIVALLWLVWWAVRAEPEPAAGEPAEGGGGGGHSPRPRRPRSPRRGDHAEPPPKSPPRIRAVSRSGSVPHQ
jgi:hypothetical protein